jgi:hypothetical protein
MVENPKQETNGANGTKSSHTEQQKIALSINALKATYEANERAHAAHDRKILKWTGAAAGAAIFYTVLTAIIMAVAIYQALLSREAIVAANRAWLAPLNLGFNSPLSEDGVIDVILNIPNVGREPASGVEWRFDLRAVPHIPETGGTNLEIGIGPNDTCANTHPPKGDGIVLWPGGTSNNLIPNTFEDTPEHRVIASQTIHREISMVVQGCVVYRAADTEHASRFRFFLRDIHGRPVSEWRYQVSTTGNEAN